MPITINNYETYFIDYHDGALSPEKVADLFLFLEQHPRIKEEFEEYNTMQLDATGEAFPEKESLKRGHVVSENLSWYLVSAMENDLDAEATVQLNNFIDAHPASRHDQALFRATRLEPGNEKFDGKRDLKKPVPFTISYRNTIRYAVAAMLLMGMIGGATYLLNKSNFVNEQRIAQTKKNTVTKQESQAPERPAQLPGAIEKVPSQLRIATANQPVNGAGHKPSQASIGGINNDVNTETRLADSQEPIDTIVPITVLTPAEIALSLDQSIQNLPGEVKRTDIKPSSEDDQYLTIWEALRNASSKEVQRLTGQPSQDEPLAYADQPATGIADLVGNGLSKLTNDKVSYASRSDETGRKSGFRFSLGGISIEK